jgi:nitronate monooxygenase
MLTTRFTELIGCTVPIQQAPMNIATPALAAAVAGAGGLGMLATWGAQGVPPERIAAVFDALPSEVPGAYGANFVLRFLDPDLRDACLRAAAERARVVECFYSDPDPEVVAVIHDGGALAGWQVGSREEAMAAQEAGCDFIAAQGSEAGGHVRGTIGLLALLDEVLDAVEIPVVAAGGIGSGRAMAAALAAGADGVRVGTRFVAATEADAHPRYLELLIAARASDSELTEAFFVGWTDAPHRVLRSSIAAAEILPDGAVGEGSHVLTGQRYPVQRFGRGAPHIGMTGEIEAMALYAGESAGGVTRIQPAAEIVRELAEGAEALLRRWQ